MRSNLKWQMEENFSRGHKNINSLQKTLYSNAALVITSVKELNEGLIHAFWEGWTERELSPLPVQGGAQLLQLPTEEQGYKAPVAYRGTRLQSSSSFVPK